MTHCNGFCSVEREIPARRTRAGETGPSAERETHCSAVCVSIAVRSIPAR